MENSCQLVSGYRELGQRPDLLGLEVVLLEVLQDGSVVTANHIAAGSLLAIAEPALGFAHLPKLFHLASERVHDIDVTQPLILPLATEHVYLASDSDDSELDVSTSNSKPLSFETIPMAVYFNCRRIFVLGEAPIHHQGTSDYRSLDGYAASGRGTAHGQLPAVLSRLSHKLVQFLQTYMQLFVAFLLGSLAAVELVEFLQILFAVVGVVAGVFHYVAVASSVLVGAHRLLFQFCTNLQHLLDVFCNAFLELVEGVLPVSQLASDWSSRCLVSFGHHLEQCFLLAVVQQPTVLLETIQAGFEGIGMRDLHKLIVALQ